MKKTTTQMPSPSYTAIDICEEVASSLKYSHRIRYKSCSIFRIPDSLAEVYRKAYKPKVVSIGPYHDGEAHLIMIQMRKTRFLQLFADKAQKKGVENAEWCMAITKLENKIRDSYSEELKGYPLQLVPMVILDGCFILMLFLTVTNNVELEDRNNPIFTIPWILPAIQRDFLLLENQVPFFVLETLFETSKMGVPEDLHKMAFDFFNYSRDKPGRYGERHINLEGKPKHLLDLIRMTFVPSSMGKKEERQITKGKSVKIPYSGSALQLISSTRRLRLKGIKFGVMNDADSILDIKFEKNRLQIPLLPLDGFMSSIFLNCVAYEQLSSLSSDHITSYVVFMGCLLNGEADATFLTNDKRIIENYFGNENEVSQFFKTICEGIEFDIHTSYLRDVFAEINDYTSKWHNGVWAEFKYTHFESTWTCLSSSAVVFIILLTMLQATFAVLSYRNDTKGGGNAALP